MIYLVSLYDKSYAKREMQYTAKFLNSHCKKVVAKCLHYPETVTDYNYEDYFVIADYKSHPFYFNNSIELAKDYVNWIESIPKYHIVIWLGDARFRVNWPCVTMAIGSYSSVFLSYDKDMMKGFESQFDYYVRPISWKLLLPQLKYDYSLAETQCCWDDFELSDKEYDLTYIMNGTIKHRLSQLKWLLPLPCKMMLGNWKNRTEPDVVNFVKLRPDATYIDKVVFGTEWLKLISKAKYTIIADDDNKDFKAMLSARFWEAVRADCIPLIYIDKDPERKIFAGFPSLQSSAYFKTADDLKRIMILKPLYNQCLIELKHFERKYIGD